MPLPFQGPFQGLDQSDTFPGALASPQAILRFQRSSGHHKIQPRSVKWPTSVKIEDGTFEVYPCDNLYTRWCEMKCEIRAEEIIEVDSEKLSGTPVFTGTRVPIQNIFDYIEGGETLETFIGDFPTVKREQALGLIELMKERLFAEYDIAA
jgi:uncharacterized protein (DUF433 family)